MTISDFAVGEKFVEHDRIIAALQTLVRAAQHLDDIEPLARQKLASHLDGAVRALMPPDPFTPSQRSPKRRWNADQRHQRDTERTGNN